MEKNTLTLRTNEQPRYKNVTFDDRDTQHLRYNENWFLIGTYNASNVGQTGTLASSNGPNATVTFDFPVPANGFFYYGIKRSQGGSYAICIDCDPRDQRFENIDALNRTDDGHNPPVLLYYRWFESPGYHTVVLKNQNDTRMQNGHSQITIDRFELQVVDDTPIVSVQASGGPVSSATSSPTENESSTNTGAIVGISVGGCALLAVIITIGLYYLRRLRSRPAKNLDATEASPKNDITRERISRPSRYAFTSPPATSSSDISSMVFTLPASIITSTNSRTTYGTGSRRSGPSTTYTTSTAPSEYSDGRTNTTHP